MVECWIGGLLDSWIIGLLEKWNDALFAGVRFEISDGSDSQPQRMRGIFPFRHLFWWSSQSAVGAPLCRRTPHCGTAVMIASRYQAAIPPLFIYHASRRQRLRSDHYGLLSPDCALDPKIDHLLKQ